MRRRFAGLLCLAAMTVCSGALGQSREILEKAIRFASRSSRIPISRPDAHFRARHHYFPLIGEVSLIGLTPARAEARIAEQLVKGKFLVRPKSASTGQVRSGRSRCSAKSPAGTLPLDDTSSTLTDILALAGGISPTGDDYVT